MRVKLKNDWFAPNGTLFRSRDNPHTFPDNWEDDLPRSAEVLSARDEVKYGDLQARAKKEHDPLAVDNANKYEWPQPEGALLADVTPSDSANDERPGDETKREESRKREEGAKDARRKELESMNEAQLRAIAKKEKVELSDKDSKSQIVNKLLDN